MSQGKLQDADEEEPKPQMELAQVQLSVEEVRSFHACLREHMDST